MIMTLPTQCEVSLTLSYLYMNISPAKLL